MCRTLFWRFAVMSVSGYRLSAGILFGLTLLFIPLLVLGERLGEPQTVVGLYLYLAWVLTPVLALAGLILLTSFALRKSRYPTEDHWRIRLLIWTLGPLGCLIAVFRLTSPDGPGYR